MPSSSRIISVDFLRGFTVVAMILVNNPGSWDHIYSPLRHAEWNGCTPTDLVFPFFLFIVGISIACSIKKNAIHYGKIAKRVALLFIIGLLLNINLDTTFANIRLLGVLQRISIVFLFSVLCYTLLSTRALMVLIILLLAGYWFALAYIPVPTTGYTGYEVGRNLAAWVDNAILGKHVWSMSAPWDPEGLLSTIPAIASGLIGVLAGIFLQSSTEKKDKVIKLFVVGILLIVVGLFWSLAFPINKNLWTSSFVLYTSGIALCGLAITYWFFDVVKTEIYTEPFLVFGSNAIAAYTLSELLSKMMYSIRFDSGEEGVHLRGLIFNALSAPAIQPQLISLVMAVAWVLLIWIPIHELYKRKIFIKV